MIKVLYLHHCPSKGGSSNSLCNLISAFPKDTVDALICCPDGTAKELFEKANIPTVMVKGIPTFENGRTHPLKGINSLRLYRLFSYGYKNNFINAINIFKPDIVHFNEHTLLPPLVLAKKMGIKTIVHARSSLSATPRWAWNFQNRILKKYADLVIAIDKSVLRTLEPLPNASVVYNPLPLIKDKSNFSRKNSAKSFSLSEPMTVGFLSLFYKQKGVFDLLEAARILKGIPHIQFLFAGSNARPNSFYNSFFGKFLDFFDIAPDVEKKMKKYIKDNDLYNTKLLGFIPNISYFLDKIDILAFPSHLDATPRSVFEAGQYGIPSIVSLEHRVEDIVRDGENGVIIPEKEPQILAETILQLSQNRKKLYQMGEKALCDFSMQFNSCSSALSVLEKYKILLS